MDVDHISDYYILDTRVQDIFERGFIPSSINIGLNGSFDEKITQIIKDKTIEILVIANDNEICKKRLEELGYINLFFLKNGYNTYLESNRAIDMIISITPEELELDLNFQAEFVIDVRNAEKFADGHVLGALNFPLETFIDDLNKIPRDKPIYIYCSGGYSSVIAASILRKNGFSYIKNVYGGLNKIKETKIPIVK
ncbi:MAG: rhodanese-like domain-containing protein [Bacteroidota bacterium]|nr:rhodanese-like domain-containing protein [Bacteroidota bacterium]